MKRVIFAAALSVCSFFSSANLIEGVNFSSNVNNNYWTNIDLGLDIARLSWADTLGTSQQKSLSDYQSFLGNNSGWRFATWQEFVDIYNWFDSDANSNGWSLDQRIGANLFFKLNGYGPAFTDQNGFDHEGYTYWQFGTLNPNATSAADNPMKYVWFADFGDQDPSVNCVSWSVLCNAAYFPDVNSPMWTAHYALGQAGINVAPLLIKAQPQAATVSEPPLLGLVVGLVALIAVRNRKTKTTD